MEKGQESIFVIVVLLIVIGYLLFGKPATDAAGISGGTKRLTDDGDNNDGDLKCELQSRDGRTITITGRGPEFERLCRQQNQPVYLYGYTWYPTYYYQWYRPWGWRRWGHGGGGTGGTGM